MDDIKTQSILSQPNINMSLNKVSVLGASPSQFNPTLAVSDCLCARSASPISGGTVRLSLCLSVCAFSVCVSLRETHQALKTGRRSCLPNAVAILDDLSSYPASQE